MPMLTLPPCGSKRRVEVDAHHGVVDLADDSAPVDLQAGDVVSAAEAANPPARVGGEQRAPFAAGSIEILIQLDPDESERVGRVVGVADADRPANRATAGVERGGDGVVGALLPVIRARRARASAVANSARANRYGRGGEADRRAR